VFLYAGLIYRANGNVPAAIERLTNGMACLTDTVASPLMANIREALGDIRCDAGDFNGATDEYRAALECINRLRTHVVFEQDRLGLGANWESIPEKLAGALLSQFRNAEAFEAFESAKSRAFLERLGLSHLEPPQRVPAEMCQRERTASEEVRSFESRVGRSPSKADDDRINYLYQQAMITHNKILEEVAQLAPEYVEWRRGLL
jgi:tetratricopeptide (TPR) repeat protein